jgi:hypothetical protein
VGFFGIILLIFNIIQNNIKMSDIKKNYSDFIKELNELIGNKSLKAFIALRYSKNIRNDIWNKYIKNEIPIPINILDKHYPKNTRNHINSRVNILNAQSSINTQRIDLANFVNDLYKQHDKKSIFIPNHKNTITHNGGAFLNKGEVYTNINNWKKELLHFKGGGNFVIRPYDEKNDSVVFCFADVDRYFRDVESGINVAKTLTDRGIILVFLGNHLIINKNDMNKKTERYKIFKLCLKIAKYSSDEKSNKMLQKNEAKRRAQKRKSPSVPHDESDKLPVLCDNFTNSLCITTDKKRKTIKRRKRKKPIQMYFSPSEYHGNLDNSKRFIHTDVNNHNIIEYKRVRVATRKINKIFYKTRKI